MKYSKILSVFFATAILFSCTEHEVIPPPEVVVELNCSFKATIEGVDYELTQEVDGYFCEPAQAKEILPNPQPSTITYYSALKSDVQMDYLQVGIGKLTFNADANIDPTIEQFSSFFNSNSDPQYSIDAENGVEIVFRDASGDVWKSYQDSEEPQNFSFISLNQESDEEGDYMKFVATFSLEMYDDLEAPTDTLLIEDGVFEGYFKR